MTDAANDDDPVPDDVTLYRRVPLLDSHLRRGRPTRLAFQNDSPDRIRQPTMSIVLSDTLERCGRSPLSILQAGQEDWPIAMILARDVRRLGCGTLDVVRS